MLTPEQQIEFGKTLRVLREGKGLSLREVQAGAAVSPGYLSLVEAGHRPPPRAEVLRRLARLYGASPAELLRRAGRADEETDADYALDELRRAYLTVIQDPRFPSGRSLGSEPAPDLMRFVVEMYELGTGLKLLGGRVDFRLSEAE